MSTHASIRTELTSAPVRPALRTRLIDLALFALLAVSLARFLASGLLRGIPAWFSEQFPPWLGLLVHGQPITDIDQRQFGVIAFLAFDPLMRLVGDDLGALATYALVLAWAATGGAFYLVARRFYAFDFRSLALLGIFWLNFTPLLYAVAGRQVDVWQLFFVSASLFLFTSSSPRLRLLSGLPLAAAVLTKLLPGAILAYLLVRDWRSGLLGVAAIGVLLGVGQVLYGSQVGLGYPLALVSTSGATVATWSTHFENNSLRGLLYKAAAGFRLGETSTSYELAQNWLPVLNVAAYLAVAAVFGLLLLAAWRGGRRDSVPRRSVEFSLAVVTMLLISPHTAHDYTAVMLPVFAVLGWLWIRRAPAARHSALVLGGVLAALLVGVFIPMSLMGQLLALEHLVVLTGNASNPLFVDQIGTGIGAYQFLGFAGLGLILAWLVLVKLERATPAELQPLADRDRPRG